MEKRGSPARSECHGSHLYPESPKVPLALPSILVDIGIGRVIPTPPLSVPISGIGATVRTFHIEPLVDPVPAPT